MALSQSQSKGEGMRSELLKTTIVSLCIFTAACGSKREQSTTIENQPNLQQDDNTQEEKTVGALGLYRNTYYYAIQEDDYAGQPKDTQVKSASGKVLVMVSAKYFKDLTMEGTGKLTDGRVLNWAGRVNGEGRFRFSVNPDGDGVGACALVPFKSIAIDPAKIKLGSTVKIKESIGMKLPNGEIHDGIWHAVDIGGAIKNDRVDLFIGAKRNSPFLSKAGITHLKPLDIQVVETPGDETNCAKMAPIAQPE